MLTSSLLVRDAVTLAHPLRFPCRPRALGVFSQLAMDEEATQAQNKVIFWLLPPVMIHPVAGGPHRGVLRVFATYYNRPVNP